ncbi:MAG TPA: LytTR family DNA-binding domain-containing protein [Dongiaceae bacterium]|nr:LytTR family DNA-binding domain-containing protein [Dongiaceae bacterium]
MKLRTLIVDDEALARQRLRQLLEAEPEIEIIGECADGREAVAAIRAGSPDLVFLDVQMPELDGFGVLEALANQPMPLIVFVTAYDQFALRAFEVHALDYLLKPFDRERFQAALRHAMAQARDKAAGLRAEPQAAILTQLRRQTQPLDRLAVKTGPHIVWVPLADIDWIESADNYVELHTGPNSHLLRETLNALEERLPPERFVRISRSAMVNPQRIKRLRRLLYGGYELTLLTGATLTLSRRYRHKLPTLGVR